MATHSSILAWKSHGQKSLVGYSRWGRKELDMTERLNSGLWLSNTLRRWGQVSGWGVAVEPSLRFRRVLKFQVSSPFGSTSQAWNGEGRGSRSISQGRRLARTRQGPGQGKGVLLGRAVQHPAWADNASKGGIAFRGSWLPLDAGCVAALGIPLLRVFTCTDSSVWNVPPHNFHIHQSYPS